MLFNTVNKRIYPFEIKMYDISIERVYVINFLGIIMDEHLNWKNHVENKTMGVLNKLKYLFYH